MIDELPTRSRPRPKPLARAWPENARHPETVKTSTSDHVTSSSAALFVFHNLVALRSNSKSPPLHVARIVYYLWQTRTMSLLGRTIAVQGPITAFRTFPHVSFRFVRFVSSALHFTVSSFFPCRMSPVPHRRRRRRVLDHGSVVCLHFGHRYLVPLSPAGQQLYPFALSFPYALLIWLSILFGLAF